MYRKIGAAVAVFSLVVALPFAFGAVSPSSSAQPSVCVCCGDECICDKCDSGSLDCCIESGVCTLDCCPDCC